MRSKFKDREIVKMFFVFWYEWISESVEFGLMNLCCVLFFMVFFLVIIYNLSFNIKLVEKCLEIKLFLIDE